MSWFSFQCCVCHFFCIWDTTSPASISFGASMFPSSPSGPLDQNLRHDFTWSQEVQDTLSGGYTPAGYAISG